MHLQAEAGCAILAVRASRMLKLLRINNIALIPSLELELGPGLTLLTGETGAGKSILIDALGLLLGRRASSDLIRTGEDRAVVEAVVEMADAPSRLEVHGLPVDGHDVVLRREVQANGKGRATVNGALVPVSLLRDLAPAVAVVHGQHEPQGLLDPARHLDELDDRLLRWTETARRVVAAGGNRAALGTELLAADEREMEASNVPPEAAARYRRLCPMEENASGLFRYCSQHNR